EDEANHYLNFHLQDPVQEWGEEEEDGAVFGITLRREPVPTSTMGELPMSFVQYHTVKVRRLKAATLERLVTHLLDPEKRESDFIQVFLSTYRAFTSTSTLIELLTLVPVIRLWLEEYSEDFNEPPQYQALRTLCVHMQHRLCFRCLVHHAEGLLKRLQEQVPCFTVDCGRVFFFLINFFLSCYNFFPQDLFVKVEPFHCLGCVWSQRDKKENRNLAPTVRATISQFNAVTNRVITSLLCTSPHIPSTSSPARIIERWIAVAQECRELKNFSSLRAILSALQSNAVYRLKKTWAAVSRESMATFDHLCETFPDENCVLTNREILVEVTTCIFYTCTCGRTSGVVPYLGTYLTVLTISLFGGLINFEKRRREFEILSQIRQLQASCSHYSFPVNPRVAAWLQTHTLLTDQESYELSRGLEPPADLCPSSPNTWNSITVTGDKCRIHILSSSLSPQSFSGSLHNVTEGTSSGSSSPSLSRSSCSSSHPDLTSPSLVLNPDPSSSSSSSCSPQALPVYNKQVADSCIIRVSVECVSNGNVYKSIVLTSQEHTPQVIQRALEKHNMEDFSCSDFGLYQVLKNGKELQIPDKANVFYAMCPTANYDFVLRQRWRSHGRNFGSSTSPGALPRWRRGR
uniref:Ral guanine nucleotide dissociation stimulator-like 3a n=1 Tax=Neolamprologus brichardi TaxID=32507 RepID=A0A3Q4HXU9_NEOBR